MNISFFSDPDHLPCRLEDPLADVVTEKKRQ